MAKLFSSVTERVAIRGLCSSKREVSGLILASTDDTHFHTAAAVEAYAAIMRHIRRKGEAPTYRMLAEDLKLSTKAREFLAEDSLCPKTTQQAMDVVDRLNQYRHARVFYSLCKEGLMMMDGKNIDVEEMVKFAQDKLAALQVTKNIQNQFFHLGKNGNLDDLVADILYGEDNDHWIPTGWKTFDSVNGGMPRGGLVLLGGASGAGKSHTVIQLAKNQAMLGYRVVVVPLEMDERETMIRELANFSGVDSLKISLKKMSDEEKDFIWRRYRKIQRKIAAMGGCLTVYRPTSDVSIEETMAAVHSYNPDVTYIDYIGLLKGADGKGEDAQWLQLGNIARYGKVYAGNHKKVTVLAAQVNEEGRLKYSQTVKEHASLGFSFVATKESREGGYLNFDMLKGRNQQMFSFTMKVDYSTSTVRDLDPKEHDALEGAPAEVKKGGKGSSSGTKDKPKKAKDDFMPDLDD